MSSLADVLLADEIRAHQRAGHTGVLTVRDGDVRKTLYFQTGRLVFAASTAEDDKLGEQLIRLGRISRAEFVTAFQQATDEGKRLGEALVGSGALTEEEVGRQVARQVQRIVLSLFKWTKGVLEFHETHSGAPPDLAVDLPVQRLLFEGARMCRDAARAERALGDPQQRLRRVTPEPFDPRKASLTPSELGVLAQARAGATMAEVLERLTPRDLTVLALYSVCSGGLVESDQAPLPDAADPHLSETGSFRVSSVGGPAETSEDPSDRILRVFETLPRATHYEILELPSDASSQDVEAAYARLTGEDKADARRVTCDVRIDNALDAIGARRLEAYEALREDRGRKAYDRSLGGHAPVEAAQKATAESHSQALRLGVDAHALLQKGEKSQALSLLLEAVNVDPAERSVRRQLAIVLADHPTLSRQAERHFRIALDLDSRDLDLRCRLARYYRRRGMLTRARLQVEAALYLDPESEPALREMEAIEALERRSQL